MWEKATKRRICRQDNKKDDCKHDRDKDHDKKDDRCKDNDKKDDCKKDGGKKLFSRAKQKIAKVEDESLHYQKNKFVVDCFIQAFQKQQTDTLIELISENVTLYSDGGGKVKAALRPITSFPSCLAFFNGIIKKATGNIGFEINNVNHQPAIVIHMNGSLYGIISFYIVQDQISEIYMTINPDKLSVG